LVDIFFDFSKKRPLKEQSFNIAFKLKFGI
jgi:hypothetical protein